MALQFFFNRRGIFFTIMTLFLMSLVVASFDLLTEEKAGYEKGNSMVFAMKATSSFLRSLESSFSGYEKNQTINERLLPFNYSIDGNTIRITTELPAMEEKVNIFFDFMNSYKILLDDTNYSNAYLGFTTDLNVPKNSVWGGSDKNISFLFSPIYTRLTIADLNTVSFSPSSMDFNSSNIRTVDVNITIPNGLRHDFNRLDCSLYGYGAVCPDNDFNYLDSKPYLNFDVNYSDCPECVLDGVQANVRGHIDLSGANTLRLYCSGLDCNSSSITITANPLPFVVNNGKYVDLSISIQATANIDELYFDDYNASVKALVFGAKSER